MDFKYSNLTLRITQIGFKTIKLSIFKYLNSLLKICPKKSQTSHFLKFITNHTLNFNGSKLVNVFLDYICITYPNYNDTTIGLGDITYAIYLKI